MNSPQFNRPNVYHPEPDRKRYIYFLSCNEFIKIGVSNDLKMRLVSYQTSNPYPVKIERYRSVNYGLAIQVERAIHSALSAVRVRGEWFRVDAATALAIADPIIKKANSVAARWILSGTYYDYPAASGSMVPDAGSAILNQ